MWGATNRLGWLRAAAIAAALAVAGLAPAEARDLDGVSLPDSLEVGGAKLVLNGIGVRTFSIFNIHIYVAGLYLEHPMRDGEAILNSPGVKALEMRFIHDADADNVRKAWAEGFESNCVAPCHLPADAVAQFLANARGVRKGDTSRIVFTRDYASIAVNDEVLGKVTDPQFIRTILATFIGPVPPTEGLKRGLLGGNS